MRNWWLFRLKLLSFCMVAMSACAYAQEHPNAAWAAQPALPYKKEALRFVHYSISEGLPSNGVRTLSVDAEGFVWIGTLNGLARWDGHRISAFSELAPKTILPEGDIKLLFCDNRGALWVKFLNTPGLFRIRLATFEVTVFEQPFFHSKEGFPPNAMQAKDGDVWFATVKGLSRYRYATQSFEHYPLQYNARSDITGQVCQTPDGKIWVGSRVGLFLFHQESRQYERIPLYDNDNFYHILACDKSGRLWISRWYDGDHGITEFDPVQRRVLRSFSKTKPPQEGFLSTDVSQIFPDGNKIWFCTNEGGLCVWDKTTQELERFEPNELDPGSLKTWTALSMARDSYGNYWVGTESTLDFLPLSDKTAELLYRHPFQKEGLIFSKTNTVEYLSNGNVVFGTDRGLSVYHPARGTWRNIELPLYNNEPYNNVILSLAEHEAGLFWAGSWNGLYLLDSRTGAIEQSYPVIENSPYRKVNTPHRLLRDSSGTLWITYNNGNLRRLRNGEFEYFDQLTDDGNDLNDRLHCFAEPSAGSVWLGTADGLVQYDNEKDKFRNVQVSFEGLNPPLSVSSLCVARNSILYMVVNDRIFKLDLKQPAMKARAISFPFPLRNCLDLIEDHLGDIWICAESGLVRYSPARDEALFLDARNFLQGNTFYSIWRFDKCAKDADGRLYFAGINGISLLRPDALAINAAPPVAKIVGLKINNETAILDSAIHRLSKIVLSHWQNNLTCEFSALGSSLPALSRYAYRLLPKNWRFSQNEAQWIALGNRNIVNFSNLQPGSYMLEVRVGNSDGVWCKAPAMLEIRILPPWYSRWWAWVLYGSILTGAALATYRYQLRRRLDQAENARLKEIAAFKSRFFTNITHEFRTPLTVILGMSEQLQEQSPAADQDSRLREFTAIIRRNGAALLRLVNEILDLSKMEVNTLTLQYIQSDVLRQLRYTAGSLHSLAHSKGVQLVVESQDAPFMMDFDPDRLSQIVHNLLSNAIKFTPSGGKVTLSASRAIEHGAEYLLMEISDTGAGIPPEDLPYIFDRYYQAKNQSYADRGGSGIGLSFTYELVKLMGGTISVESVIERGATFKVLLPVRLSAPTKQLIATQEEPAPWLIKKESLSTPEVGARLPALLLIEDNPDVMAYLSACLQGTYRLYQAYNGRDGVELAFETAPDLVLSDVMMPVMDGFEVCQALKNDHRTSHVPIVLLTAKATMEDRIAGLQRGADAYLAKPFNQAELLLQLGNLLQLRQRLQARYAGMELPEPTSDPELEIEDKFLRQFRQFIESQLDNPGLSVDDLCRAVGMGRTNLHQKISSLTGQSAMQYVRAMRLREARRLLETGGLNVSEVAFAVGFDDPKYFSRVFTEAMGMPPTRWRSKKP